MSDPSPSKAFVALLESLKKFHQESFEPQNIWDDAELEEWIVNASDWPGRERFLNICERVKRELDSAGGPGDPGKNENGDEPG